MSIVKVAEAGERREKAENWSIGIVQGAEARERRQRIEYKVQRAEAGERGQRIEYEYRTRAGAGDRREKTDNKV